MSDWEAELDEVEVPVTTNNNNNKNNNVADEDDWEAEVDEVVSKIKTGKKYFFVVVINFLSFFYILFI